MPSQFLSSAHYEAYGNYTQSPSDTQLARYFYLDDFDQEKIKQRRRPENRLGFALQLVSLRFLGTFVEDLQKIPTSVLNYVAKQLVAHQEGN